MRLSLFRKKYAFKCIAEILYVYFQILNLILYSYLLTHYYVYINGYTVSLESGFRHKCKVSLLTETVEDDLNWDWKRMY